MKILKFVLITGLICVRISSAENAVANFTESSEKIPEVAQVVIQTGDKMRFDTKEFTVMPGQRVELTLKNRGKLPKVAMGHNLVVLQPGTNTLAFALECIEYKLTTGLPSKVELHSLILASTKMLGPGENETISFIAPGVGDYSFICTFPGHAAVAKGVMRVKQK